MPIRVAPKTLPTGPVMARGPTQTCFSMRGRAKPVLHAAFETSVAIIGATNGNAMEIP